MDNINVIVFTMKGCPFCIQMKDLLIKESIDFHERDIDDHKEEYDMFVKITENEYVPSIMVIEETSGNHKAFLYAPERDYGDLNEAVKIIKKHQKII